MSGETSDFHITPQEAVAVAVMQLLSGKQLTMKLNEDQQKQAQSLASALRRADKAAAYRLSAEFYRLVMPAAEISRAYFRVHDEPVESNANFQIVMDSLKENHGHEPVSNAASMPLNEALLLLLLAMTASDKNSIYYSRIDEVTGKVRPTTFPLTEKLVKDFLHPFGDQAALQKRILVIQKGVVMGNPAAQVAWLYGQRKRVWEQQKALADEARKNMPKPVVDPYVKKLQEVRAHAGDFAQILKHASDADEKSAQQHVFQGNQLKYMIEAAGDAKIDFKQRLEDMYAEKITRQKASLMAMKLSIKLKRMMTSMGTWDNQIWREFQGQMQELGIWDGSDWLAKWSSDKTGKQHIAKAGKEYLVKEKSNSLEDMLDKSNKIKDKLRGLKMLSNPEPAPDWLKNRQPTCSHEQRKALDALARQERLEDLIDLSFAPEQWEAFDPSLQFKIYQIFATYYYTDMAIIKELLLKAIDPELLESAKTAILELELNYNKIVGLFEHDHKLSYAQAVEILFAQNEEQLEKDRMNSLEYQRSPAAQYGKYTK